MAQQTATELALFEDKPLRMSYEDYLEWDDENTWTEWVDGEIILIMPPNSPHQELSGLLFFILQYLIAVRKSGKLLHAPFQMKTGPGLPGREPDLLFIATEHLERIRKKNLEGPADLVIEIISADSSRRDRVDKRQEYAQGGVREYWIIDQERRMAEFLALGEDGVYHLIPVTDNIVHSVVLEGCWLNLDWLWQDPLPDPLTIPRAWGLI